MYCYTSACLKGRLFCATCFIFFRLSPPLKDLFTFSSPPSPLLTPQPSFISIWLPLLLGIPHWATPSPPLLTQNNIASLYNQLVPIRTDGRTDRHVSIPETPTKIHKGPQFVFVCIIHSYALLTKLQCPNLYVYAQPLEWWPPYPQNTLSTNSIQSTFSHRIQCFQCTLQYYSATYDHDSEMFSAMETSNQNFVCIYCFQCYILPYNIWQTVQDM